MGPTGNGKEGGEGKRRKGREETGRDFKGGEGVTECPNPELASLSPRSDAYLMLKLIGLVSDRRSDSKQAEN